jgi:hypothetical protein
VTGPGAPARVPAAGGWGTRFPLLALSAAVLAWLLTGIVIQPARAGETRFVVIRAREVPTLALVRQPLHLQVALTEAGRPPRPLAVALTLTHVASSRPIGPLPGREDLGDPGVYTWSFRLDAPGAYVWDVDIEGVDSVHEGPFPAIAVIESPAGVAEAVDELRASFDQRLAELQRGMAAFAERARAAIGRRIDDLETRLAAAETRARAAEERLVEVERQLLGLRTARSLGDAVPILLVVAALALVLAVALRPRRRVRELDVTEQR